MSWMGARRRESSPGSFPPHFLESPGAKQRPAHQAKFWGWDMLGQFQQRSPQSAKKSDKIVQGRETKIAEMFCKMVSTKNPLSKMFRIFWRILLKKSLQFKQNILLQKYNNSCACTIDRCDLYIQIYIYIYLYIGQKIYIYMYIIYILI